MLDPFTIKQELRFLYDRNRINVAITRARKKCILFVSDLILKGFPSIYSSGPVEEGFSYLQVDSKQL